MWGVNSHSDTTMGCCRGKQKTNRNLPSRHSLPDSASSQRTIHIRTCLKHWVTAVMRTRLQLCVTASRLFCVLPALNCKNHGGTTGLRMPLIPVLPAPRALGQPGLQRERQNKPPTPPYTKESHKKLNIVELLVERTFL